jgi:hypothetical protein
MDADTSLLTQPADLQRIADRINAEHEQAAAAFRDGLLHARNAGRLLLTAKKQCGHGRWLPWLRDNVYFSARTAQAYMRVASRWPELEAKAQGLAHLSFEAGLKLLAAGLEVPTATDADGERPPPVYDTGREADATHAWLLRRRARLPAELREGFTDRMRRVLDRIDTEDWFAPLTDA